MDFKVVEIPESAATGFSAQIVTAMQENIGKAIAVPFEKREPNALRKMIRSGVSNRGLLRKFFFRSKAIMEQEVLLVWLEAKTSKDPLATAVADANNRAQDEQEG